VRKVVDDERLMVKVCEMYYDQDIHQKAIAKSLGISRPTVSRLLKNAKALGIVEINIKTLEGTQFIPLERQVKKQFGLNEVLIVETCQDPEAQKKLVGEAAAQYLMTIFKDNDIVGISMGSTLRCIPEYLKPKTAKNLSFIPLIGGMGYLKRELHSNYLVEEFAKNTEGAFVLIYAPARVSEKNLRDKLLKEDSIAGMFNMINRMRVAVVGIGVPNDQSAIMATGFYNSEEMKKMQQKNVAGDICMQFFDEHGNTDPFESDNNVVGIEIKRLRNIPHTVGVACGIEKCEAIIGAIQGSYINTLITDEACAKKMIEKGRNDE